MNTRLVEIYLARLYTDPAECARFLADPRSAAARAGLGEPEIRELERIDRVGLRLASTSFTKKRALKSAPAVAPAFLPACITGLLRRLVRLR